MSLSDPQSTSDIATDAPAVADLPSCANVALVDAMPTMVSNSLPFDLGTNPAVFNFILETANDAVYIFDENRFILYANARASQMTGYSKPELEGMNLRELDPVHPGTDAETFRQRAEHGVRLLLETVHRHKNGNLVTVEISLAVALFNGKLLNIAFVRDIMRRKELQRQQEHMLFALENASDAIYIYDRTGKIHFANAVACEMLGYTKDEIKNVQVADLDPMFSESNNLAFWALDASHAYSKQTLHRKKDGTTCPVEIIATATLIGDKESAVCFVRDISERIRAENAMRESEDRFRMIADTSPVGLLISERHTGNIRYCNVQALRMFGTLESELVGQNLIELLSHCGVDGEFTKRLINGQDFQNRELQLQLGDQTSWFSLNTRNMQLDRQHAVCLAMMDVTEARELSNQLSYQATYDDLTGLVNRREFEDRLQEVIDLAQDNGVENSICYLDLDQFKVINDTCGHMAGDEMLRQIAQHLFGCLRRDDTLARLGGDEFAVLLENCSLPNAEQVASNIHTAVQNFRFFWQDKVFTVGVSIGIAQIYPHGETLTEVLRRADAACYAAKEAGRNRVHVFREDDEELAHRHVEIQWVSRIHSALDEDRFELWYQEIAAINRGDDEIGNTAEDHFEVLLRMRDSEGRTILPGNFLPAAERYDLAPKIDRWVIRNVIAWLTSNPRIRKKLGLCAINLSGRTLSDESFQREVIELLENSELSPESLCFEITETSAISNLTRATQFMNRLKEHGCLFALDDFGRGLSSFAYLKSLPVDFIKIDGFFVKDMVNDPVDKAMVKAIIDMAHALGKKAIAEFVESDEILQELIDLGIDYVQGFGIAKPLKLY
jgi:diguanylate cyclase (GGDEF)-like protein/PAS domain S-box-containing protein